MQAGREVKFRAWNPHQKIMLGWDRLSLLPACQFLTDNGYKTMQFTGLRDNNGKEIYEGDIFAAENDVGVIRYRNCGFYIDWLPPVTFGLSSDLYYGHYDGGVIGNVYENPALLKAI